MKELVVPFRGERYRAAGRLGRLIAPPYDVIPPPERARLAALDAHNIVHVMLPEAPAEWSGDRYAWAADRLAAWRRDRTLTTDPEPAAYVMAQGKRLGVFAALAAEGYEPRRVRPHEQTHAGPKADRLALLKATRTNIESIFLIAPDGDGALVRALKAVARRRPLARTKLDGVPIRLWAVRGKDVSRFPFPGGPLYIADGHHRYETASVYARENPAADRMLAFVASARDPGLVILPTHRLIYGAGRDPRLLHEHWRAWFDVAPVPARADPVKHLAKAGRDRTACLVAAPDGGLVTLTLRADAALGRVPLPELGKSDAVRALDVARVETLVVKPLLAADTSTPTLRYTADATEALDEVRRGAASAAVLLNPTRVEQVFAVADAGDVMPPKSTYFAPKVPSGLVLRPAE